MKALFFGIDLGKSYLAKLINIVPFWTQYVSVYWHIAKLNKKVKLGERKNFKKVCLFREAIKKKMPFLWKSSVRGA